MSRKYLHNEVAIGGRHIPPEHESALSNVQESISPFGTNVKRRSPKRLDTTADVEKKANSNFAKNYAEKVVDSLKKEEKETLKEEKRSDHLASTAQTDVCNSHDDPFKGLCLLFLYCCRLISFCHILLVFLRARRLSCGKFCPTKEGRLERCNDVGRCFE